MDHAWADGHDIALWLSVYICSKSHTILSHLPNANNLNLKKNSAAQFFPKATEQEENN
jgi:hypothetical protein